MKTVRRTKIRLEKYELTLIRFSRNARLFCGECRTETTHLAIAQTAAMLSISEKTVFRLAEFEQVHSLETTDGKLMICAESAANFER